MDTKIAVLIPAFNEEKRIENTVNNAKKYCSEIIVIDDGSTDNTLKIINNLNVTVLVNKVNQGLTKTLKKGFKYALDNNYDAIVKIDADGQMNPMIVLNLINEFEKGDYDIICGTFNTDTPFFLKIDVFIYSSLFSLASLKYHRDIISEFRLLNKKAIKIFLDSRVNGYSSNLSIINSAKKKCKIYYLKNGVDFTKVHERPFPLESMIRLRYDFFRELWNYGFLWSKIVSIISIPILALHLVFNLIFARKYNSIKSKNKLR